MLVIVLILEELKNQTYFTQTEKRIADYILQHSADIPGIFIEDLAKLTYTSHSAIIRLAKKMGFTGFREFKVAISSAVHSQLHTVSLVDANFPFDDQDSPLAIAKKMADLSIETITKTLAQLEEQNLAEIAEQLTQANRVFIFAKGDSQIRARSFQNKLVKINKFFILADEYSDTYWHAVNLTPQDCGIFLSYSGIVPQYERIMSYFQQEEIPRILLSGNPNSLLVPLADKLLLTVQEEYDFAKIGTFASQTAFEFILDSLFSIMYAKEYRQNLLNLEAKQSLLQDGLLSD